MALRTKRVDEIENFRCNQLFFSPNKDLLSVPISQTVLGKNQI